MSSRSFNFRKFSLDQLDPASAARIIVSAFPPASANLD
jgi:hypothetical protein